MLQKNAKDSKDGTWFQLASQAITLSVILPIWVNLELWWWCRIPGSTRPTTSLSVLARQSLRPPYLSTSKCMAVFVFAVSYKLIVMSWSCCNTSFSRSQHMHNTCPKLPGSIHRSIQNFNALGMAVSSCRTKLNSSRNAMKPWRHAPGNIVLLQKSPECSKKDCVTCSCSEYLRGFHN